MKNIAVLCLLLFVGSCLSSEARDPRWFTKQTRTIVKTFKTSKVVVETTPSSCVVVESSLPPCRHLRSFWPFVSPTTRVMQTKAPGFHKSYDETNWKPAPLLSSKPTPPLAVKSSPEPNANPPPSWDWDIFNVGPREVTVTKTIEQIYTTRVYDPNTVVTFSVKGCRPSRLPFDLLECKQPEPVVTQAVPEKSVIVMAPVQFVHAVDPVPAPAPAPSETKAADIEVPPVNVTNS